MTMGDGTAIDHPTGRPNYSKVWVGDDLTLWFSYRTCIAFEGGTWSFHYRENDWSNTTGGHILEARRDRVHHAAIGPLSAEWFTAALDAAEQGITAADWWESMTQEVGA